MHFDCNRCVAKITNESGYIVSFSKLAKAIDTNQLLWAIYKQKEVETLLYSTVILCSKVWDFQSKTVTIFLHNSLAALIRYNQT